MNQPMLPKLYNTVAGVVCSVQATDLPEEWPQVFKDLGSYILEMNDVFPDVFDRQLADLKLWLKNMDNAVDVWWEPCDEHDPAVPRWYRDLADWADGHLCGVDLEDWQLGVFTHVSEDRNKSKQLRCKCELMLYLWQSSWPDYFQNLLGVIQRYERSKQ